MGKRRNSKQEELNFKNSVSKTSHSPMHRPESRRPCVYSCRTEPHPVTSLLTDLRSKVPPQRLPFLLRMQREKPAPGTCHSPIGSLNGCRGHPHQNNGDLTRYNHGGVDCWCRDLPSHFFHLSFIMMSMFACVLYYCPIVVILWQ